MEDNTARSLLMVVRSQKASPSAICHMHPSSTDDDDDCFLVQLKGSEMSPRAPKVSAVFFCFKTVQVLY